MKARRCLKKESGHSTHNMLKPIGAVAFVVFLALGAWWYSTAQLDRSSVVEQQSGMTCDMGISAAKSGRVSSPRFATNLSRESIGLIRKCFIRCRKFVASVRSCAGGHGLDFQRGVLDGDR